MSHVAAIDLVIDPKSPESLTALQAACKELGLIFVEGQKTFAWFGTWVDDYDEDDAAYKRAGIKPEDYGKCEHAIKLPGCNYEIGVVRRPDGKGLTLIYDFFGEGKKIQNALGTGCEKLRQLHGFHRATMLAKAKGHLTRRVNLSDGRVKLQILR